MNSAKQQGPLGRMVRDLVLPIVLKKAASAEEMKSTSWIFSHHIEWDEPVRS
jgi:hypothetical protein